MTEHQIHIIIAYASGCWSFGALVLGYWLGQRLGRREAYFDGYLDGHKYGAQEQQKEAQNNPI